MKYEQIPPPPSLQDYVQYFWTLDSHGAETFPRTLGPLVDGHPGLIFQRPEQGVFHDQQQKQLPPVFVYGQTLTRTELHLTGHFATIGVRLYPHALKPLFGFDAHELTDTCLNMDLLSGHLSEQLLYARTPTEQMDIVAAHLQGRIRNTNARVDGATRYALNQLLESKGAVTLRELQQHLRLSERSFERRFRQYVGVSPKLFARVCRFQAAFHQLKQRRYERLSDIAFDNGYADQSHFIREFREFAGYPPFHFKNNLT